MYLYVGWGGWNFFVVEDGYVWDVGEEGFYVEGGVWGDGEWFDLCFVFDVKCVV